MGNLVSQPETRKTQTGRTVTVFSMATSESFLNANQEKTEHTDFHRIVTWQHLAEICHKYLQKGSRIFIEGKLKNRSYLDKEGKKKFLTEVIAHDMNILTWPEQKEKDDIQKNSQI